MSELLAALLGAVAAYVFDVRKREAERRKDQRQAERERKRHRESTATALLQDLRGLEPALRQFYHADKPALWNGQQPSTYFAALRDEVKTFTPDSVQKIDQFHRSVENLFDMLRSAPEARRRDDRFNYSVRVAAGFALQALPAAKEALLTEGGQIPEPRVLEVVYYPDLPKIPKRSFPDVPAPGVKMPDELQ